MHYPRPPVSPHGRHGAGRSVRGEGREGVRVQRVVQGTALYRTEAVLLGGIEV